MGLQVGENANNLDFCNFKNGSISGYKFNDHNGNAAEDSDDEHLAGWEITLSSVTANGTTQVDSAITDANGDYSFSNVAPGTYQVCETNKTNWVQTYPTTNNGCHEIVIDVSNEQNTAVKFGNQGQGTVRVLKNIDMNNDGDTTDAEDIVGATNWQWTLDATAPQNTGAAAITTSAGSHTISEVQQAGYYVTGVSCSGEDGLPVSTSASIQLSVGENVVCTFTNARTLTSLTVNKVVINDNGGNGQASDFSFTMNGVVGAQTFVNNAGSTTSGSVALSLDPGTYTATEVTPHVGYTETSNTCQNIVLTLNQPASCTITNDDIAPTLTVIKNVTNSAGGNNSASSFDIRVNNVSLTGAVSSNNNQAATYTVADVAANTPYTVSEVASFGYNQVGSISCTDNETQATIANPVTLNEAQNVTCVINNIDVAPKLTLQKSLPSPQYGDTATPHDWTLTATPAAGTTLSGRGGSDATDLTNFITRTASSNLVYTLSESGPSGYTPGDAWSCQNNITGSTFSFTTPNQISLDEGADVTCTIINTAIQPKLVVIKHVVNDNGGTKTASDFTMNVTAVSPSQTSFAGSEAGVEVLVNVGDYSIDETEIAGYKKTLGEDCTGSISVGETKTCTITNDDIPPVLVVTKVTYPDEDAQDFNFTVNNPGGEDGLYASPVLDTDESSETPSSYSTQAEDSDEIDMNSRFQAGSTSVSEALPEGWVQNAADCFVYDDGLKSVGVAFEAELGKYYECAFYNERAPKLDISKTNDQPNPIKPGTVVNYTVTLTVPESSGKVYGDCKRFGDEETTDLEEFQCQSDEPVIISDTMPVGVTYNPGSFRIVTNQDENDFTSDVTEPVFSNGVGVWEIPFVYLFPGEVITLTYSATVDSTVQPGCFTNQVFGKGYDFKGTSEVLTPFADSKVCVPAELAPPTGQVLSATKTVLVNTGRSPLVYVAVGVGLVILAVGLSRRDSRKDLAIILFAGVVGWTFLHGGKGFAATAINLDQPTSPGKISSLQLGYQVSETDALQDFTINLYQNGSLVSSQNLSEAYGGSGSFVVNLPNDGSYNFYAVAVSTSGNTKQSNSVSYVLDKTAPASSSSVGLTRTGNTYAVTYTVPEGSGAANVFIYASSANPVVINEANKVASLAANPGSAQTFSYTAPDATPRNFAVVVVDSLGNASTPVANEVVTTQTVTNTSSQPSSTTSSSSSSVTSSSPQILPAETVNEPETDDQTAAVTKIADAKQASNNGVWWVVGGLLAAGTLAYVYRRYQDAVVGSDDKKSSK